MKQSRKSREQIQYGFKRISITNLLEEDDHAAYPSRLCGAKWVRDCQKPKLIQSVPEEVVFLFEVARGAMIYGLFFLPLAALATEEGFRVLEAGVRHRSRQIGLIGRKSNKPIAYADLIIALHEAGDISKTDLGAWQSMVALRNQFSHRTAALIRTRQESISQLSFIAKLLNRLFK